jgi:hypothetical protein
VWERPRIIGGPLVGLGHNKTLIGSVILTEAFFGVIFVLDVLHVGYDGLGVEAVFLVGAELFVVELLALYSAGVDLAELGEVCIAVLVGLGGVVCDLRAI